MFAILGSLPIDRRLSLDGARVADLFAGSGALGIEALSRGAAGVTFVDDAPLAVRTVATNLASLGLSGPRAQVVRTDALRWLETAPPTDLVLADPPYSFDQWARLACRLAPVAGLVLLETGGPLDLGPGWEVVREKHYGGTVVLVAQPVRPPGQAPRPDLQGQDLRRNEKGDT